MLPGQIKVDRVAHLMRQSERISQIAREIHEQVRVEGGGKSRAEGPAVFSFAGWDVDPLLFEDLPGDPPKLRMKALERLQEESLRLVKAHLFAVSR